MKTALNTVERSGMCCSTIWRFYCNSQKFEIVGCRQLEARVVAIYKDPVVNFRVFSSYRLYYTN